jgi:hypothetical protein
MKMLQIKQVSPAYSFQGHADLLIETNEGCWYFDSIDGTFENAEGTTFRKRDGQWYDCTASKDGFAVHGLVSLLDQFVEAVETYRAS